MEKAFWDKTKSFLQSKVASVGSERGKTPVNWIFQSPTRLGRRCRTTSPGAKPFLQLTFIRPEQRFIVVFELKRPSMSVQNLFFAKPVPKKPSLPLFPITGCEKRRKDVLLAPFFAYFTHHRPFISSWKWNQSCKLLVDPGHPQEELVGGRPHHRYIKDCRRRPRVDWGLQKNTCIADNHAKKLPEASVSLKWIVFKLCCPAHLFPNTPRTLYQVQSNH